MRKIFFITTLVLFFVFGLSDDSFASRKKVRGVKRDHNGKIARSSKAKKEYMRKTGYSKGRRGYVIDHIKPLKRGGADKPSNMQWQTKREAKAKDKIE